MHKKIEINDEILDNFIELVEKFEDDILYDYNGKENQILIKSRLVEKISSFLQSYTSTENTYTLPDLIKAYIRAAFELNSNSVVISKNGNIFIKIIDETVKREVPQEEKNTVKNRFNGVNEEELKSFYDEFFKDNENNTFFLDVAKEFVSRYFLIKKISNDEYEKNVFAYIHAITLEKLVAMYDDDDGFFLGFAGYIFRLHFKEVFEYISELILDELAASNQYMMDFLNYYSQDILVIQGIKYKIPHIEAENGLRWSVPSMLSIVKIYTKAKHTILELKLQRNILQNKVEKFYVNGVSPIKNNELLEHEKTSIEIQIEETTRRINALNDRYDITKDTEKKAIIKEDLLKKQEILKTLRKKREDTLKKVVKKSGLAQYMTLQKELDSLNRKLQREKKIIKQNEESYKTIKSSLVKALISKKSKL